MADVTTKVRVTGGEAAKGILDRVRQGLDNLRDAVKGMAGGTRESTEALQGVQAAAAKAAQGYRTVAEAAQASAAEAAQAFEAAFIAAVPQMANKGANMAKALASGLRAELERSETGIKEALFRGLITPAEADARGRAAGKAFNDGMLKLVEGARTTTRLTDESRGPVIAGLVGQLKDVDVAAKRASTGGLRTLARSFAGLAAQQLAFRSGLGSILTTLGLLTLSTGVVLGVTAGLAAIAFAIRKIREAAEEAKRPLEEMLARAEALREAREDPEQQVQVDAAKAQQLAIIARQDLATAKAKLATLKEQQGQQGDIFRNVIEQGRALREVERIQLALNDAVRAEAVNRAALAGNVEARIRERAGAVASLIAAEEGTNAIYAERQRIIAELERQLVDARRTPIDLIPEKQRTAVLALQADLVGEIDSLRKAGVKTTKEQKTLDRSLLDLELERVEMARLDLQIRLARRDISEADALVEDIKLLERRRQIIEESLPGLEEQARLLRTPEARAGVAHVNRELAQTDLQIAELRASTQEWRKSLEELQFQDMVAQADPAEGFRLMFERSHGAIRAAAEKAGDVAVIAFLDRLVDEGSTRGAADKLLDNLQRDLAGVGRQQQQIEIQLDVGEINQETFFARRLALLEQERAVIQAALPDLRKYAAALDDPALQEALAEMGVQFEQIGLRIHEVRLAMEAWKIELVEIGEDALAGLFTDLMTDITSYKAAFLDMARAVVQALTRMIAQMIAAKIAQQALGSLFGLGAGAAAGSIGGGSTVLQTPGVAFGASGGLVRGPGSATSDSIPARLSDGEYVVRAAVVRRAGIKELLDALNYGGRLPPLRPRATGRYAAGGLVERPRAGAELSGRLDIGLDEGLVVRGLETNAAARALLRVVARNPRAFQRALA